MLRWLSLLAMLLFYASASATEQHASASLDEAKTLIQQGKDGDAITALQQLVQHQPSHVQAWFLLGVTEASQHHLDKAIDAFNKVISLQPTVPEPHNNLAVIYNEQGNLRAAVKELETSLQLNPGFTTAQENIGDLYVKLAANAYHQALAHDANPALRQRYERLLRIGDASHDSATQQPNRATPVLSSSAPSTLGSSTFNASATNAAISSVQNDAVDQPNPVGQADAIKGVMTALEAWRSAWNHKDLDAYFFAYSPDFEVGSRFKTLEKWQHYKQWAIKKRAFIMVTLEDIKATPLAGGAIRVDCLQHFRSDSFNSDDAKELVFQHSSHGWKIIREISK